MAHALNYPSSTSDYSYFQPLHSHMSPRPDSRSQSHPQVLPTDLTTPRQQNARRLKLRHAGFRGTTIPGQRLSHLPMSIFSPDEPYSTPPVATSPLPLGARVSPGSHSSLTGVRRSPSPGRILQEISNFATAKQSGTCMVQQHPATPQAASASAIPGALYDENTMPPADGNADELMSVSASTAAEAKQRAITPLQIPVLSKRRSRHSMRSANSGASRYIDHLETELASAQSRLDTLNSPNAAKAQSTRIRALVRQSQSLREDVAQWEQKFEERVEDEVFARTHIEADMRNTIRHLEDELNVKDLRSQDLERELESLQSQLSASRELESNLGRRIDVLTGLLAQSPTREYDTTASQSGPASAVKKTPRPRSMMLPRLHPPPCGPSDAPSPDFEVETPEFSPMLDRRCTTSEMDDNPFGFENIARQPSVSSTTPSSVRPSLPSISPFSSRPTSLISNASLASSWGIPLAPDSRTKQDGRSKRMRRFMSGSTSLKPLLLTSTNSTGGSVNVPQSAPLDHSSSANYNDVTCSPTQNIEMDDGFKYSFFPTYRHFESQETYESHRSSPVGTSPLVPRQPGERASLWSELARSRRETSFSSPSNKIEDEVLSQSDSGRTLRFRPPNTSLDEVMMEQSPTILRQRARGRLRDASETDDESSFSERNLSPMPLRIKRQLARLPSEPLHDSAIEKISNSLRSIRYETLLNVKDILLRSWRGGTSTFGGLGWWLLGLASASSRSRQISTSTISSSRLASASHRAPSHSMPLSLRHTWSRLFAGPRRCPDCSESLSNRSLQLWCKFSLALILAIGVAIIEGPGILLSNETDTALEAQMSSVQLAFRRQSEDFAGALAQEEQGQIRIE